MIDFNMWCFLKLADLINRNKISKEDKIKILDMILFG